MLNRGHKDQSKEEHQKLDLKLIKTIERLIDDDIVRGKTKELLESLRDQKAERGFLTIPQRQLIKKINKDCKKFPYQNELCDKLIEMFNNSETPPTAEGFIRSVIDFFDASHSFTPLQQEQIIRIVYPDIEEGVEVEEDKD